MPKGEGARFRAPPLGIEYSRDWLLAIAYGRSFPITAASTQ